MWLAPLINDNQNYHSTANLRGGSYRFRQSAKRQRPKEAE